MSSGNRKPTSAGCSGRSTDSSVITGIGVVHAVARQSDELWRALCTGSSSFALVSTFDISGLDCKIASQIDREWLSNAVEARKQRTTTSATQFALISASEALRAARGEEYFALQPREAGVYVGTALGGWVQAEEQHGILLERGANRVNPFISSGAPHYGTGIELAKSLQVLGPNLTFASGCPASLQAIAAGSEAVRNSCVSIALCGGTESPISPVTFAALCRSNELTRNNESPNEASRPFDRTHDGMVLAEGACFLVIESIESAIDRGASVMAEVLGAESSCDAGGMYFSDLGGGAGAEALTRLLKRTGVTPDQIDYVCAHANSSPAFDRKEVTVLKRAFGEFAAKIPVSSIKGVLGHPFGASGAFQTAAAALAMQHGMIPHTHNLVEPDPECDLDLVMGEPRPATIRHALITSYGYGGVNSFLLLRNPNL